MNRNPDGHPTRSFVVTGIKGERIAVLHKLADEPLKNCLENLAQSDLPNLWKPRADSFVRVEAFPYLGTGKLDLRRVREIVDALVGTAGIAGVTPNVT